MAEMTNTERTIIRQAGRINELLEDLEENSKLVENQQQTITSLERDNQRLRDREDKHHGG